MTKLNLKVIDMENTIVEFAKKVSYNSEWHQSLQEIHNAFETHREERLIANQIREAFDKQ